MVNPQAIHIDSGYTAAAENSKFQGRQARLLKLASLNNAKTSTAAALETLTGMDDRCDRGSRPTQGSGGARTRRWFRGCAKEAVVGDVAMQVLAWPMHHATVS
ncbi:hypothetical protein MUK42_34797 [Musa troglodytarum]|uniref:Uncharacterized protein n=1 Tax=Musa troglodytarum TaxID=320322 RepID=A0A9E7HEM9_9LILI|nr:hypothetical protein MUK42_34797 [Musa troglodytarum]